MNTLFLDWKEIEKRRNPRPKLRDLKMHQKTLSKSGLNERQKAIGGRSRRVDLAMQPRMILRRRIHQEINKKGLTYLTSIHSTDEDPPFQFLSLITSDLNESKNQLEFIKNLSNYVKLHSTNLYVYKPELDQVSTDINQLGYLKARILLNHLNKSHLIWIDQDILILDQQKSMLDIISQYPDKNLILFYDDESTLRMNLMIWKPSPWTLKILTTLLAYQSSNDPTQVLLDILAGDVDRKHVLVPFQVLMNPEKKWMKSFNDIPAVHQPSQMRMANVQLGLV